MHGWDLKSCSKLSDKWTYSGESGSTLGLQRNRSVSENLEGTWKKTMHESKQWDKMSFGDTEMFLEARNAKPREADRDYRGCFLCATHTSLDFHIVMCVVEFDVVLYPIFSVRVCL